MVGNRVGSDSSERAVQAASALGSIVGGKRMRAEWTKAEVIKHWVIQEEE